MSVHFSTKNELTPSPSISTKNELTPSPSLILFRLYVQNFGSYNKSLGALGGVMVLLFWFWVVALVLLGAAEMDREIEAGSPIGRTPAR